MRSPAGGSRQRFELACPLQTKFVRLTADEVELIETIYVAAFPSKSTIPAARHLVKAVAFVIVP